MTELERRVDAIMDDVPLDAAFSKWCNAGPCACSGCVNGYVQGKITESMWDAWRERHERRSPANDRRHPGPVFVVGFEKA